MITKEELKTTVKVLKELVGMKVVHTEMRRGQLRDNEGKIERYNGEFGKGLLAVTWPNSCGGSKWQYKVDYLAADREIIEYEIDIETYSGRHYKKRTTIKEDIVNFFCRYVSAGLRAVVDCHYKKGDFEWDATKRASYPMTRQQFAVWMDVYFE